VKLCTRIVLEKYTVMLQKHGLNVFLQNYKSYDGLVVSLCASLSVQHVTHP